VSLPIKLRYAGKDQVPGCNLYVTGLPVAIKEAALRATFASCGEVARLRLLSQSGRSETHALVEMMTSDQAAQAIRELNGILPEGHYCPRLVVRFATRPAPSSIEEARQRANVQEIRPALAWV